MDLNAALILVRIVDKGSFTAAAQELGMTKATVSRRIAELEQRLGARLLYRSTRQLTCAEPPHLRTPPSPHGWRRRCGAGGLRRGLLGLPH